MGVISTVISSKLYHCRIQGVAAKSLVIPSVQIVQGILIFLYNLSALSSLLAV